MTKRTERGQRRQAENGGGPTLVHLVEPMLAGMSTTRQHLLAWVHAHGLAALDELFREEAVALAGPKGRHHPQAHASSLGDGGDGAHLRGPARAGPPPPRAAAGRRRSDIALGRDVSRPGPADRADDAAVAR